MDHSLSKQQGLLVLVTQHLVFWHQVMMGDVDQQSALVEVFELKLTSHRIDNLQQQPPKSAHSYLFFEEACAPCVHSMSSSPDR